MKPIELTAFTHLTQMPVFSISGDELGHIKDVVFGDQHNVLYYALAYGGVLGIGEKFFAIAPEMIQIQSSNTKVIANLSRSQLDQSDGFDKDHWPDAPDAALRQKTSDASLAYHRNEI